MRVAALTVALLSSAVLVSPAQATFPGGNGLIAYYDYSGSIPRPNLRDRT